MPVKTEIETSLDHLRPLQAILQCPVERCDLSLVSLHELLERMPDEERSKVAPDVIAAFVSERARRAYPVMGRIVSFLDRDVLRFSGAGSLRVTADAQADDVKRSVQDWYDRFGWQKNDDGLYHDTALFSQDATVGHGYYETSSHLSFLDRLKGGDFVIDAASGAMAHPETLSFSWHYRFRICVDLSITALREAERKVGNRGFYCLADICNLPFRSDSVDGAVSGYTIQHIPESQQEQAVRELFRVLRPGSHLCIMTDVKPRASHGAVVLAFRAARKLAKLLGMAAPFRPAEAPSTWSKQPHALYFVARDVGWWQALGKTLSAPCSVECLRSLNKTEYDVIFGQSTRAAKLVRSMETIFARLLAPASPYCLVDITKP